jgi:diaminopimelate decarboxylase
LGINYANPKEHPPFEEYFNAIGEARTFFTGKLIVELGRSLVGQHAVLLTKVLFTKGSEQSPKVLVDAGMTDLARPALYQAYHDIENVLSDAPMQEQNVFGPICESSDCFAKKRVFPKAKRGDILAIHSVGAYGETMQSGYNLRDKCPVEWI